MVTLYKNGAAMTNSNEIKWILQTNVFVLFFISFFLINTNANSQIFGPKNYEDCIIDNMKGVTSNLAAQQIKQACENKFPKQKQIIDKMCYFYWTGLSFKYGKPDNIDDFIENSIELHGVIVAKVYTNKNMIESEVSKLQIKMFEYTKNSCGL